MNPLSLEKTLHRIFPTVFSFITDNASEVMKSLMQEDFAWQDFPLLLETMRTKGQIDDFIPELAQVEAAIAEAKNAVIPAYKHPIESLELNPTVAIIETNWQFADIIGEKKPPQPMRQKGFIIIWQAPQSKRAHYKKASAEELLCVKMAVEELSSEEVAEMSGSSLRSIQQSVQHCCAKGILLGPESKLRRSPLCLPPQSRDCFDDTVQVFTIQWHITHDCDLHCRHCYDRSKLEAVTLEQTDKILADLWNFCVSTNVAGHVCFSGGNPFMHPDFFSIYRKTADYGFSTSILGNPVEREQLIQLLEINHPEYYQISLEGLEEHNNYIRGKEHFERSIAFLELLDNVGISSAIMLTLTRENMPQVLELAEYLKDKTDHFTFNRLSTVGEGAKLQLPEKNDFVTFIKEYVKTSLHNPIIGYKDNLINIELSRRGLKLFDGCTGFGCGAAFNFMAVLPNGEAHACRKFPSPIGNVLENTISEVYDSKAARKYRVGSRACRHCRLKPVCGGCMASVHGHGGNVFEDRDPFCFYDIIEH